MSINDSLNTLFEGKNAWRSSIEGKFVSDGLIRLPGFDEQSLDLKWKSLQRRVVFLLKDNNQDGKDKWNDDLRNWFLKDQELLNKKFFRRIANLLYGFSKSTPEYVLWGEEVENNLNGVRDFCYSTPFAMIECKKQPGEGSIKDSILTADIERHKDYLEAELKILDPNIIVCMGGPQFKFALNMYKPYGIVPAGINEKNNANVYYVPTKRIIIVYSGHPSTPTNGFKADVDHYEGAMDCFCKFIMSDYYKDMFL